MNSQLVKKKKSKFIFSPLPERTKTVGTLWGIFLGFRILSTVSLPFQTRTCTENSSPVKFWFPSFSTLPNTLITRVETSQARHGIPVALARLDF